MGGVADPTRTGIRWTNGCPYVADQAANPSVMRNPESLDWFVHFAEARTHL